MGCNTENMQPHLIFSVLISVIGTTYVANSALGHTAEHRTHQDYEFSAVPTATQGTAEPISHNFQLGLQRYISAQRVGLDKFEEDVSNVNLDQWLKNLLQLADFDMIDYIYRDEDSTLKARYKLILTSDSPPYKYENLLFLTHDEGSQYCARLFDNGTLLTIHIAHESSAVMEWLFRKVRLPGKVWLGASKLAQVEPTSRNWRRNFSSFIWDDTGTAMTFTNWHVGISTTGQCEPNNVSGDENCVEMLSPYYPYPVACDTSSGSVAGRWNDISCYNQIQNAIVCKTIINSIV